MTHTRARRALTAGGSRPTCLKATEPIPNQPPIVNDDEPIGSRCGSCDADDYGSLTAPGRSAYRARAAWRVSVWGGAGSVGDGGVYTEAERRYDPD